MVGARCAGSPTAMLLARRGYRVLLLDKRHFPSDTVSSHFMQQQGVALIKQWGLLERLVGLGAPPVRSTSLNFGPFVIRGSALPMDGVVEAYATRRTLLDEMLLDAAAESGAEVREGFTVEGLTFENGVVAGVRGRLNDREMTESAAVVVGADGRNSMVAREVGAPMYDAVPPQAVTYYSYWSDVPTDGLEIYVRPDRSWGMFPTNEGLTCIALSWPVSEFEANRHDVEGNFLKTLELVPDVAERARAGTRVERFRGTADVPNFFRKPFGDGWALVGDAGYHKDPCTAQGIGDGFRDAQLLAEAIDTGLSGRQPIHEALGRYERARNEHAMPIYQFTCELAALQPPPPEKAALLAAVAQDPQTSNRFVSLIAGSVSFAEFFAPENIERTMAVAG
ncbi:oxidoreductase [Nocardioides gansuensis]|uniref:Oxidoreductase n=1 Tax=Nocardioides gansuensis TaxID=2138300 RepID=A0A2T8F8U6_9ACTN|nr:oxidoreductase [Nocardioides gansuensis]